MNTETKDKIIVKGIEVRYSRVNQNDYMSLTDIAQYKNPNAPKKIQEFSRNPLTVTKHMK